MNCSQCLSGEVKQGKYETSTYLTKFGVVSVRHDYGICYN